VPLPTLTNAPRACKARTTPRRAGFARSYKGMDGRRVASATWLLGKSLGYVVVAGVATADTLYWGVGFAGVSTSEQRKDLLGSAMRYLGAM
jgi:hypothetical protein